MSLGLASSRTTPELIVDFGRELTGDREAALSREWLITNGLGSYAAGTVAGALTRRYHGILIAAEKPPLGRMLLCSKLEEAVRYREATYELSTNVWQSGAVAPAGHRLIERFYLDGTSPVWSYALGDALLEKRLLMLPGRQATYAIYRLLRGSAPAVLRVKVLIDHRDFHGETQQGTGLNVTREACENGQRLTLGQPDQARSVLYLRSERAALHPQHDWYRDFALPIEKERGFAGREDHLHIADFEVELSDSAAVALCIGTEPELPLDGERIVAERAAYEQELFVRAQAQALPRPVQQLVLAADQFVVARKTSDGLVGHTLIAGYPWFADWGRDTMISLPGLTLCTGRPELAGSLLRTFARHVDRGMLPNRFPDAGEAPVYNTVDAALWYFQALRAYFQATKDLALVRELWPTLCAILDGYRRGTRFGIEVAEDGLVRAGEPGVQLTWMDAKVGDWVVTPRIGKPIEIAALYYSALRTAAEFSEKLGFLDEKSRLSVQAEATRTGFARYFSAALGYCLDVLDGPGGDEASLRPNQLYAVALPHSPLPYAQQKAVVDVCAQKLLVSHGLRSLSPEDPRYIGRYLGDMRARDAAYHQGTAWGYLIGPFVAAHLRVYRDPEAARSFLIPLLHHQLACGLGSISEIFDGDAPHAPRGCFAQAWSVAEWLRADALCRDPVLRAAHFPEPDVAETAGTTERPRTSS